MDTQNTPYSIKRPTGWDRIVSYSRGGEKPPEDMAQRALDELIENIRLSDCVYFPDVVNSILRRVPGRIQAENYGHQGFKQSFYVADTSQRSEYYRVNEPVLIELLDQNENQYLSEQCIRLKAGEWVAYNFDNPQAAAGPISVRVRRLSDSSEFRFSLNGEASSAEFETSAWTLINFPADNLNKGKNEIKLAVGSGELLFDWIEISDN